MKNVQPRICLDTKYAETWNLLDQNFQQIFDHLDNQHKHIELNPALIWFSSVAWSNILKQREIDYVAEKYGEQLKQGLLVSKEGKNDGYVNKFLASILKSRSFNE